MATGEIFRIVDGKKVRVTKEQMLRNIGSSAMRAAGRNPATRQTIREFNKNGRNTTMG